MHLIDFSQGQHRGERHRRRRACRSRSARRSAFQMQGKPNVALTFFGDGATNIGTFHEALNMAAHLEGAGRVHHHEQPVRRVLPAADDDRASTTWPAAPTRTGCPGIVVDGQDIDAVHAATVEAVERARGGDGPSLLEMKTYRYRGHSRSDPAKYRPDGELEAWKARDPIEILGGRARRRRRPIGRTTRRRSSSETQAEIDAAAERAAAAPYPTLEETRSYVYAD